MTNTPAKKNKTLLKVNPVSSNHWSSGKSAEEVKQTKCVVQIIKASQLLASDAETGKSDPVCFMKFCPQYSGTPDWNNFESPSSGILSTAVVQACTDPIWNSYHTFPLILESYAELLNSSISLLIRDEDAEEDGTRSYDDLGQAQISLKESIKIAKVAQRHNRNAFMGAPVWHTLEKCPGMRKKDGKILVSVSVHFEDEDTKQIQKEVGAGNLVELMSKYKADSNSTDTAATFSSTTVSHQRKKSNAALTPRVASPTRLFNDSLKTPLLKLPPPQEFADEKKYIDAEHNDASVLDENIKATENNDTEVPPPLSQIEQFPKRTDEGVQKENKLDDIVPEEKGPDKSVLGKKKSNESNLVDVQNEELDLLAEMEDVAIAQDKKAKLRQIEEEEKESAALMKVRAEEQSKALLSSAVKKAKAEAEVEAARIIARAKAEIEVAKEAAKQQLEIEEATKRATREIENETEAKLKRLQQEAEVDETERRLSHLTQASKDIHEGDLYWDENDNIAGGNSIVVNDEGNKLSNESPEYHVDVAGYKNDDDIPTTKQERKSKIPKLRKSTSSSSLTSSSQPNEKVSIKKELTDAERKKKESRARIQKAKKDFKKKQAENEAKGSLMDFIPMEPPQGDQQLPPQGDQQLPPQGDQNMPPENNDMHPDVNDDESVASTTVDDEEFSPRKSGQFPGQGSRPDTIRALREISLQREQMNNAIFELQRTSDEKFSAMQKQLTASGEINSYHDERGDDQYYDLLRKSQQDNSNFREPRNELIASGTKQKLSTRDTISSVLQNGDADDIGIMLETYQAQQHIEELSLAMRAQLYEYIGLLLRQGKFKDTCLNWIVALLNPWSGKNFVQNLPDNTCASIVNALVTVSSEPNNRGVLAARLEYQMVQGRVT